jgi:uncharacterized protein YjbI with pentapeptide repeats
VSNKVQLEILKKGVETWNNWRQGTFLLPDLREADLHEALLPQANLCSADLILADLSNTVLTGANLQWANLHRANISGADLRSAILLNTDLSRTQLCNADFRKAMVGSANFASADLTGAKLQGIELSGANLSGAKLTGADVTNSVFNRTILANLDLSDVRGLETVRHEGPSTIGLDTIYLSGGKIPEIFLRGAGAPEPFISNMKSLVAAMSPIEFYSCFISYSSKDREFAERLYADLQSKGVRCWFAPEDLKIGDKLRPAFDEAIRLHDKLMVVLSENSVDSPWVEKEIETAFEKERRQNRTVLFPIRIDDAVMDTDQAWAADIRRSWHIGDFRDWKNHDSYKKAFERLLRDLKS